MTDDENEVLAVCENCSKKLYEGDPAHVSDDVYLCENCAPSYNDLSSAPELFADDDGHPHSTESARPFVAAHLERGGKIADKIVWPL